MKKKKDKNIKEDEIAILELGKFYFLNGKYDKAIEEFEKILKINSRSFEAFYNLGLTYEAKNMKKEACQMYEKTLEINLEHQLAKKHLDKLIGT